jgi:pyridoxal phosphate enzyme (YggS family)
MEMVGTVAANLAAVRSRIAEAARRAGRDPSAVRLMAVTKGFPRETVMEALEAGASLFGENRVQEAETKFTDLAGRCETHLIGHLQTNKAKAAAALFDCVQSIDSLHTAEALDARCGERGRTMDVLLELNTSGEGSKSGFPGRDELAAGLAEVEKLLRLRVRGLMTVGPLTDDEGAIRAAFGRLRSAFEELAAGRPGFDTLSMGMSSDFQIAIEEGATLVRVGTALFGPRGTW